MAPKKKAGRKKRKNPMGTKNKFMSKSLAYKRYQGVDTKVFYFKRNATAHTDVGGVYYAPFLVTSIWDNPSYWPQFHIIKQIYDQYKVLGITIRFFPCNVGIEPHDALLGTDLTLVRGNTVVWQDQKADDTLAPTQISQVIGNASSRLVSSRRPFTRKLFRPKGYPEWGDIQATAQIDPWKGSINVLVEGATPASITPPVTSPQLYFFSVSMKVVFRGRSQP